MTPSPMIKTTHTGSQTHPHVVTVLGAGAWGEALRFILMSQGVSVRWWNRSVKPHTTQDLAQVLTGHPTVILAISSAFVPEVCHAMARLDAPIQRLWITSKGLDPHGGDVLSATVQSLWPEASIGVLAGPNIASEVLRGEHCGVTLASHCDQLLHEACQWFRHSSIWAQSSRDVVGTQWWSVLKNVVAIGYGLLEQKKAGHNLSATYLTMAMQEIAAFAVHKGGLPDTALSFAGVGDVILTSQCPRGRNRAYGEHFPAPATTLVEGLETLKTLETLSWFRHASTPLPLMRSVALALRHTAADQAINEVLSCMTDHTNWRPSIE